MTTKKKATKSKTKSKSKKFKDDSDKLKISDYRFCTKADMIECIENLQERVLKLEEFCKGL